MFHDVKCRRRFNWLRIAATSQHGLPSMHLLVTLMLIGSHLPNTLCLVGNSSPQALTGARSIEQVEYLLSPLL